MIIGHGIDIMSTSKIEKAITQFGNKFLDRIYTSSEKEFINKTRKGNTQIYASYWAVKEACMKALGTGNRNGVRFKDIEVHHESSGKPYLKLFGKSKEHAEDMGVDNISISMSHLKDIVAATVIFEKIK